MRILEDVGCILIDNRQFAQAETALRRSIAIAERLPDQVIAHQDLRHRRGHINNDLGHLLGRVGRWREAEAVYAHASELFQGLAADYPDLPLYQVDVAEAQLGSADVMRETGRLPAALDRASQEADRMERLCAAYPELVNCRRALLAALTRLGRFAALGVKPSELEPAYRRALASAEQLVALEQSGVYPRLRLGSAQLLLADYLNGSGRPDEGKVFLSRAVATMESVSRDCPDVPECQQTLGEALMSLGQLELGAGHRDEAEKALARGLCLFQGLAPQAATDPELAERCVRGLISCSLERFRDPASAVDVATRAAANFSQHGLVRSALGLARYCAGDWQGAIAALRDPRQHDDLARTADLLILAMAYHHVGEEAKARTSLEHACRVATPGDLGSLAWVRLQKEATDLLAAL